MLRCRLRSRTVCDAAIAWRHPAAPSRSGAALVQRNPVAACPRRWAVQPPGRARSGARSLECPRGGQRLQRTGPGPERGSFAGVPTVVGSGSATPARARAWGRRRAPGHPQGIEAQTWQSPRRSEGSCRTLVARATGRDGLGRGPAVPNRFDRWSECRFWLLAHRHPDEAKAGDDECDTEGHRDECHRLTHLEG